MMNRDQQIHEKINQAVRLLCDVYELLNKKEESKNDQKILLTISQFVKKHSSFSHAQIRNYIFNNIKNFNEKVTRRVGKRIFIDEDLFFKWMGDEI